MNFRKLLLVGGLATFLHAQEPISLQDFNSVEDPNGHYLSVQPVPKPTLPPLLVTPSRPTLAPKPAPIIKSKPTTPAPSSFRSQIDVMVDDMAHYGVQTTADDLIYTIGVVVTENNTVAGQNDVISTIRNSSLYDFCNGTTKYSYSGRGFLNPGSAAKFPKRFKNYSSAYNRSSEATKLRVAREITDQYIEAASSRVAANVMDGPVKDALYFNSMWLVMQGGEVWRHDFLTKREGHYFYTLDGPKNWGSCYVRREAEKFKH